MNHTQDRGDATDPLTEMREALNVAAAALATIANNLRRGGTHTHDVADFAYEQFAKARAAAIWDRTTS